MLAVVFTGGSWSNSWAALIGLQSWKNIFPARCAGIAYEAKGVLAHKTSVMIGYI
jgi:hypothetical protein